MDAEEEGLRLSIAFFEKINGFLRHAIRDVIRSTIDLSVVDPFIVVVVAAAEGVCLPIGISFLRACAVPHVPFAGKTTDITRLGEIICESVQSVQITDGAVFPAEDAIRIVDISFSQPVLDAMVGGNSPCEKGCAGGGADRGDAEEIFETNTIGGNFVDIRCFQFIVSCATLAVS